MIASLHLEKMPFVLTVIAAIAIVTYLALHFLLHITQDAREPCLTETKFPFFDSLVGIAKQRAVYLVGLG